MNDLADLTMLVIENFEEYIEGSDNPIDTTIKILKDLKKKNEEDKNVIEAAFGLWKMYRENGEVDWKEFSRAIEQHPEWK